MSSSHLVNLLGINVSDKDIGNLRRHQKFLDLKRNMVDSTDDITDEY